MGANILPSRVVITGGPCAGKTTILAMLRQKLHDFGFKVFIVPEVATEFINSGINPAELGPVGFQKQILLHIIEKENRWLQAALMHKADKKIILCDSATMDGMAYVDRGVFGQILDELKCSIPQLRDSRYDAVIHMRTAALGAEEFYTLANNTARSETPEQAREIDERRLQAWNGHPHLRVIENGSGGFEEKKRRVLVSVCRCAGIPAPIEIECKYLVEGFNPSDIGVPCQIVAITQHYLASDEGGGTEERIRARGQGGSWVYYHTLKKQARAGVRLETERQITEKEYLQMLHRVDRSLRPIYKSRVCFLWKNQYFELDMIESPKRISLLEIELTEETDTISLPPFLKIKKEVTGDLCFSNYFIAKGRHL